MYWLCSYVPDAYRSASTTNGRRRPPGTTVRFESDRLTTDGLRENRVVTIDGQLSAAVHSSEGNVVPEEFDAMVDPMAPGAHRKYTGIAPVNF